MNFNIFTFFIGLFVIITAGIGESLEQLADTKEGRERAIRISIIMTGVVVGIFSFLFSGI